MWIFLIIVVVVVFIIIASNNKEKKFIKNKVALHGGMLNFYKVLVDGLLEEDGNAQIIQILDDSISVGVTNLDDSAIFRISQHIDKTFVVWTVKRISLGNHVLRWEFPDGLDQNEMLTTIKSHVINYLQNLPQKQVAKNDEFSLTERSLAQRKISLEKLASTFNCSLDDVQSAYYKDLDDSEPTKNDLDYLLNLYSKSIFDEAIENKTSPKNTVSGIVYYWTIEYSKKNKLNNSHFDINIISNLYDSNPVLMSELINAKINNDHDGYDRLLSDHPEFHDLFISNLADISDSEKTSNLEEDDYPF